MLASWIEALSFEMLLMLRRFTFQVLEKKTNKLQQSALLIEVEGRAARGGGRIVGGGGEWEGVAAREY